MNILTGSGNASLLSSLRTMVSTPTDIIPKQIDPAANFSPFNTGMLQGTPLDPSRITEFYLPPRLADGRFVQSAMSQKRELLMDSSAMTDAGLAAFLLAKGNGPSPQELGASVAMIAGKDNSASRSEGTMSTMSAGGLFHGRIEPFVSRSDSMHLARKRLVELNGINGEIIIGPRKEIADSFSLKLIGISPDQKTYWPNEKVNISILMPGRPNAPVKVTLIKKGGTSQDMGTQKLDENGVLHLVAMDGTKSALGLGEYTVEAKLVEGKLSASAEFSVIEGTLGALSFGAHWQPLTEEQIKGEKELPESYYYFNEGGGRAGDRWGHGLHVRNTVMDEGRPYNGEVTVKTRCYLPQCDGVEIDSKTIEVKDGVLEIKGLSTESHSGPFEIEVITDKGTLRYLFPKTGHVERRMVEISSGMSRVIRAGLSPYAGTQQVPGRPFYYEMKEGNDDAFFMEGPIADENGHTRITIKKVVMDAKVYVYTPDKEGKFAAYEVKDLPNVFQKDESIEIPVTGPYSTIVIAGYIDENQGVKNKDGTDKEVDRKLVEGYAMIFTKGGLEVRIDAPAASAPFSEVVFGVKTFDPRTGSPLSSSGILTVFDTRVESPSPASPLDSELGRSLRDGADALGGLEDTTGMGSFDSMEASEESGEEAFANFLDAPATMGASIYHLSGIEPVRGGTRFRGAAPAAAIRRVSLQAASSGTPNLEAPEEAPDEGELREGVAKVVFSGSVSTGPDGYVRVPVELGPQTGRYRASFTAVKGLETATGRTQVDATMAASAEANVPAILMDGASIDARVVVNNSSGAEVTLRASGAGLNAPFEQKVTDKHAEVSIAIAGGKEGALLLEVIGAGGKVIDRRQVNIRNVGEQKVTTSSFHVSDGRTAIQAAAGEKVVVYRNVGHLLKGVLTNMTTTMASWFPHAEAVSANIAANALILKAIEGGIVDSEGETDHLVNQVRIVVNDLKERFFNETEGLATPYPGMKDGNTLWSAWVARNLQGAVTALEGTNIGKERLPDTLSTARELIEKINSTLAARGESVPEFGGYDPAQGGRDVIAIKTPDGRVMQQVLTDTSVIDWVVGEFYQQLKKQGEKDVLKALYKMSGVERLKGAYSRIGDMPYLIQLAKVAWLAGEKERAKFYDLFSSIARTAVRTQEPGMVQGPALLGGIYSNPQAMVRFLELLMMMAESEKKGERKVPPQIVKVISGGDDSFVLGEEKLSLEGTEPLTIESNRLPREVIAPEFSAVMVEGSSTVRLTDRMASADRPAFFKVGLEGNELKVGERTALTVTLGENKDPLEYEAFIVVPSTVSIHQTADIQLKWTGEGLLGQRAGGSEKVQMIAVPFRGSREMKIYIDGAYKGASPGMVLVRHMHDPNDVVAVPIPAVKVG